MKYHLFFLVLFLSSFFVKAQNGEIYYKELDTTFYSPEDYPGGVGFYYYDIDFDNDSIYDFTLGSVFMNNPSIPEAYGLSVGWYNNHQLEIIRWNICQPPPSPTVGDTISKIFRFGGNSYYQWSNQPTPPEFSHDYMLVCKYDHINSPDIKTYGWLEFSLKYTDKNHLEYSIHRYAFCTDPDYHFRVGQTDFNWTATYDNIIQNCMIYPNPTDGLIKFNGDNICAVEVYDILGNKIIIEHFNDDASIDLSNLTAGIYLIKTTDRNGTTNTEKIIKL